MDPLHLPPSLETLQGIRTSAPLSCLDWQIRWNLVWHSAIWTAQEGYVSSHPGQCLWEVDMGWLRTVWCTPVRAAGRAGGGARCVQTSSASSPSSPQRWQSMPHHTSPCWPGWAAARAGATAEAQTISTAGCACTPSHCSTSRQGQYLAMLHTDMSHRTRVKRAWERSCLSCREDVHPAGQNSG